MKVLAYTHKYSGCSYHRVLLPMSIMDSIDAVATNKIDAIEKKDYDIFFFNRINHTYDGNLDAARKQYNCKVVVDIDDSWELPYGHPLYGRYIEEIAAKIKANVIQADCVTTTTFKLAELIYKFNKNVVVIPNALPYGSGQFNDNKEESSFVRIFWCGGSTHENDIKILENPIKRLAGEIKSNIKMVVGGYINLNNTEAKIWNNIMNCFTYNRNLPYDIYEATTPDRYMQFYEHADICIIPLQDLHWNSYKSNLKILEAACKKIPVIVSNVAPYNVDKDAPVLWVNNQKDWYKHLRTLINEKEKRESLGKQLYEWAKSKYNLHHHNETRQDTFRGLINA